MDRHFVLSMLMSSMIDEQRNDEDDFNKISKIMYQVTQFL